MLAQGFLVPILSFDETNILLLLYILTLSMQEIYCIYLMTLMDDFMVHALNHEQYF